MYEEQFPLRLARLRVQKGVSARDMSLSIGQNSGYINNIESGKSLPSMTGFFYICEYLGITPKDFFEFDNKTPQKLDELISCLKKLNASQLNNLTELLKGLVE